ncbi:MAG: DUF58 domain-containing protein [Ruminococcaceae bacterium]|nr:DUF58 domain-containing protein [Oscillospiraceae bacterium]
MELLAICVILIAISLLEILLYTRYAFKGISYTAFVNKNEIYEGDIIELTEVIENRRLVSLPWIKTELSASRWLNFSKKDSIAQTSGSESTFIPGVFSLKPRSRCTRVRRIKCIKRGVFAFEDTIITATDILGLVKTSINIPVKIQITVLPIGSDGKDAILSFEEPMGEISIRRFINEDPFVVSGSKEYTGREPLNKINWNYTASQNKLFVSNNEYTTSRTALVLMNMQRNYYKPVTCANIRDTEAFIKMSTRIMEDCVRDGCHCAFATNGGSSTGIASDLVVTPEHFEGTLRILAQLENTCSYDFKEFCDNINSQIFTDIFVITHYIDDFMLQYADKLRIHGINTVFLTTGEIPEESVNYQFIPITKFSYKWNLEGDDI